MPNTPRTLPSPLQPRLAHLGLSMPRLIPARLADCQARVALACRLESTAAADPIDAHIYVERACGWPGGRGGAAFRIHGRGCQQTGYLERALAADGVGSSGTGWPCCNDMERPARRNPVRDARMGVSEALTWFSLRSRKALRQPILLPSGARVVNPAPGASISAGFCPCCAGLPVPPAPGAVDTPAPRT
jgi:hypothetical protein